MKAILKPVLILALAALPGLAQVGPGWGPGPGRIARILNLTDAQKASIKAIHEKHQADLTAKRDAMKLAQTALRKTLAEVAATEAQIRPLFDKASTARFDLMMVQRTIHQEVQAILTPEQRAKAAEMRAMTQAGMRQRMRRMGMGH